ncbi:MAG: glycosyltransferase [Candidatus Schekmanbacteria bacterium]|nr:glycosyltransferase [Candidatus Schekmanbacteria bacterium]
MATKEKILCITTVDWDHEFKGIYHHIPYVLANEHEVVFVERVRYFSELSTVKLSRFFRFLKPGRKVKENLLVITPPPAIPLLDKIPLLNRINDWIFLCFLKMKLKKLNFKPTILWLFSYNAYFTVGKLGEGLSLYYCYDQHSVWETSHNIKREELLAKKVNLLFATSTRIAEGKKQFNDNIRLIQHGVDLDIYNKNTLSLPQDLKNIQRPVIGYIGNIKYGIDLDLFEYIAQAHPEWSIVLIGPLVLMSDALKKRWENLPHKNIYLLGYKPIPELPAYIHSLDVALLPYLLIEDVSWCGIPLKLFEYLVMGKPIVSTDFVNFEGIPSQYYEIGKDYRDFVRKIEESLKNNSPEKEQERIAFAQNNSWQKKIEEMFEYINIVRANR